METIRPDQNRLYPIRYPENLDRYIEELQKEPEILLTPEQKEALIDFERTLTQGSNLSFSEGELLEGVSDLPEKIEGLERCWEIKAGSATFYLDFFMQPDGQELLADTLNSPSIQSVNDIDTIKNILLSLDLNISTEELESKSLEDAVETMTQEFANNSFESVQGVRNPTRITIIKNPEKLVEKLVSYKRLKQFYKDLQRFYKEKDDPLSKSKTVILKIHQQRLNELIADSYSLVAHLFDNYQELPTDPRFQALQEIEQHLPGVTQLEGDQATRALSRLNKFIYGAGDIALEGHYTAITQRALETAKEAEANLPIQEKPKVNEYSLNDVAPETLHSISLSTNEVVPWLKKILAQYNLLSQSDEYDPKRTGRAPDGKWQVVVVSQGTTRVNRRQGVIKFPKNYQRLLTSITPDMGVAGNLAHEIEHVIQAENQSRIELAIMGKVGAAAHSSLYKEAGAIQAESETILRLFGQIRPTNLYYLRAIQAKLAGGTFKDCVFASYISHKQANPDEDDTSLMRKAIDRTLRIFRNGGNLNDSSSNLTNSQPLVYLEQELVAEALAGTKGQKLLHIAGITPEVAIQLRRIGFFDLDKVTVPDPPTYKILEEEIRSLIQDSK